MNDIIFLEKIENGEVKLAAVNKNRIWDSENPGNLASVYTWEKTEESDAQVFYVLGKVIGADDFYVDLTEKHRTPKLNNWSIILDGNNNSNSLFEQLRPLTYQELVKLYSKRHDITPQELVNESKESGFLNLVKNKNLEYKTGILQRCFDCILKPQYRGNAEIYALMDQNYRKVMRFKVETEDKNNKNVITLFIRKLLNELGLKHSQDPTPFTFEENNYVDNLIENINKPISNGTSIEKLSSILYYWSGSKITSLNDDKYQLEMDSDIEKCLSCCNPLLSKPDKLHILDDEL